MDEPFLIRIDKAKRPLASGEVPSVRLCASCQMDNSILRPSPYLGWGQGIFSY